MVRIDPPEPPPPLTQEDARAKAAVEADNARRRMERKRQAIADEALRKKVRHHTPYTIHHTRYTTHER